MSVGQFKLGILDDSIFEYLRRKVVALGYYPDLLLYQPESPVTVAAFKAALAIIEGTGKTPINTVAVGIPVKKGEVKQNTIYVHRVSNAKGSVSVFDTVSVRTDGLSTPPNNTTTYARVSTKGFTQDIQYEIRFVSNSQANADLISGIIISCFTQGRDYYDAIDLTTGNVIPSTKFLFEFNEAIDLDMFDYKEYVYRYTVIDAWVVVSDSLPDGVQTVVDNTIVPIVQITDDYETD